MNRLTKLLFFFFIVANCYGQDSLLPPPDLKITKPFPSEPTTIRQYFFENVNFAKEGKELVILVKEPQTKLAEDFGYRYYSDTNFLSKIESEFYRDIDPRSEEVHFCGHDIYFYIKSGRNLKLFKQINSHCGINELGCENVDLLARNGTKLSADSLKILDFATLEPKEIIKEKVLFAEYISSDGIWQDSQPLFYNNCSKPNWIYDGKFQAILEVDNETPVDEYIRQFFSHVDSLDFKNINYRLDYEDENQLHIFNNTSTKLSELRLNVYLDKDCYHYFEKHKIEPNFNEKKKIDLKEGFIILIQ